MMPASCLLPHRNAPYCTAPHHTKHRTVPQAEGWRGLFRGTGATLLREVPLYAFGMSTYQQLKKVRAKQLKRAARIIQFLPATLLKELLSCLSKLCVRRPPDVSRQGRRRRRRQRCQRCHPYCIAAAIAAAFTYPFCIAAAIAAAPTISPPLPLLPLPLPLHTSAAAALPGVCLISTLKLFVCLFD